MKIIFVLPEKDVNLSKIMEIIFIFMVNTNSSQMLQKSET